MLGRSPQLGIISLAVLPAVAGTGPAAPIIIAALIIADFLPVLFHMIGQGRTEADYLTAPNTGAQWKLEHIALPGIIDPYTAMKNAGTLTASYLDGVQTGLNNLRDGFVAYAGQFQRAGPGAISTIEHVINDILLPDVRFQYQFLSQAPPSLPSGGNSGTPLGTDPGTLPVPAPAMSPVYVPPPVPVYVPPVISQAVVNPQLTVIPETPFDWWPWIILGLVIASSKRRSR